MATKREMKKEYPTTIVFDKNFQSIVQFYLFECPVDGVSHRGVKFKDYGWHGSSRFQMLERLLKAAANMDESQWNILKDESEVRRKSSKEKNNRQFLYSDRSKGKVQTFIYSIRNAFAHGSFDFLIIDGQRHYLFVNEYRGNLRSKMLLSESTLIEWIKIIKTSPDYLKKKTYKNT